MPLASFVPAIDDVEVAAYSFPLAEPETDGTHAWSTHTMILVRLRAGGREGYGYTYSHACTAGLIHDLLRDEILGCDPFQQRRLWHRCSAALRNLGRSGIAASAIAAVDTAAWDLAARILDVPLYQLLGGYREAVPLYGSGGFTSQPESRLLEQLSGWAEEGMQAVKMKVGRDAATDRRRVALVEQELGEQLELLVDANGAYQRQEALLQAEHFADHGVSWFEEPVDAQDFEGLHLLVSESPPGMEISAGEYGYQLPWFRRLLQARAVDVLQADVTRCAGITGFLSVAELCLAHRLPLSTHAAPALHRHVALACPAIRHCEWFADHVTIEQQVFDGAPQPVRGSMQADRQAPGHGLIPRLADLEAYRMAC